MNTTGHVAPINPVRLQLLSPNSIHAHAGLSSSWHSVLAAHTRGVEREIKDLLRRCKKVRQMAVVRCRAQIRALTSHSLHNWLLLYSFLSTPSVFLASSLPTHSAPWVDTVPPSTLQHPGPPGLYPYQLQSPSLPAVSS